MLNARCTFTGTTTECITIEEPSGLAPDDYDEPRGGSSDNSNLCPHPLIEGHFIPCDICLVKDQYGNCIDTNPGKLCSNSLNFVSVSSGFVAEVEGLGAWTVHNDSGISYNVEYGSTCVTMSPSTGGGTIGAAHVFAVAYNAARDRLDEWIQFQDPEFLTTWQVRTQLTYYIAYYLDNDGYYITSPCTGSDIPISVGRYDLNC